MFSSKDLIQQRLLNTLLVSSSKLQPKVRTLTNIVKNAVSDRHENKMKNRNIPLTEILRLKVHRRKGLACLILETDTPPVEGSVLPAALRSSNGIFKKSLQMPYYPLHASHYSHQAPCPSIRLSVSGLDLSQDRQCNFSY